MRKKVSTRKKEAIEETTIRVSTERTSATEVTMKKARREEAAEVATEVEVATEAEETVVASSKEMTMTTMASRRLLRNLTNQREGEVVPTEAVVEEAGEAEVTQATTDHTPTRCPEEAEARSVLIKRAQLK